MFPDGLRNAVSTTTGYTVSGTKWMFNFSGKAIWIAATSFMILALPVVFEVERVQTQEAELAQQRQVNNTLSIKLLEMPIVIIICKHGNIFTPIHKDFSIYIPKSVWEGWVGEWKGLRIIIAELIVEENHA